MNLEEYIEVIPDFPKKGVQFKDVTSLMQNGEAYKEAINQMSKLAKDMAKEMAEEMSKEQNKIFRNELISNFLKLNKLSDEEVAKCFNISVEQLNEIKETAIMKN